MAAPQKTPTPTSHTGHDAPILNLQEDLLGAGLVARAVHRTIRATPAGWSTRIGLYGAWGSGKTSILNLLETLEAKENSIVVRLSAWSVTGEAGVLNLFYEKLREALKREGISAPMFTEVKRVVRKGQSFANLGKLFGKGAEVGAVIPTGASDAAGAIADAAFGWIAIDRKDIDVLVSDLGDRRVVVFIDDFDRADPKVIPKTLLALRELLDWPRFTFVLAFDRRMIASALREYSTAYGDNAQMFLEKVVDVPFEIAAPSKEQKRALASKAFCDCGPFVPTEVVASLVQHFPDEPRRVKLIARKVGILKEVARRHAPGELNWVTLILYNVLDEQSPEIANCVAKLATSEQSWLAWAGDKAEADEAEQSLRAEVTSHLTGSGSANAKRIGDTAVALMQEWAMVDKQQIEDLVTLVYDEPTFTRKEIHDACVGWLLRKDDAQLSASIALGADRGGVKLDLAANAFLTFMVDKYQAVLLAISDSETEAELALHSADAAGVLAFIEHLWLTCTDADLRFAAQRGDVCGVLVSCCMKWAAWTRSQGEIGLRNRERELTFSAAEACSNKESLYEQTDPFWEHGSAGGKPAELRMALRSRIEPAILHRLIGRFAEFGALRSILQEEDKLAIWMLESDESPLYKHACYVNQLTAQFEVIESTSVTETHGAVAVRGNALPFLEMLLGRARGGMSWSGDVRRLHVRFPMLVPAAWRALVTARAPLRMARSIVRLRDQLVAAGVDAGALVEPLWLSNADRELVQAASCNDSSKLQMDETDSA